MCYLSSSSRLYTHTDVIIKRIRKIIANTRNAMAHLTRMAEKNVRIDNSVNTVIILEGDHGSLQCWFGVNLQLETFTNLIYFILDI